MESSNGGSYYRGNENNGSSGGNSGGGGGSSEYNPSQGSGGGGSSSNTYDPRFYGDVQDPTQVLNALLPALKQLDINQIPPDLLAYLLKTKRIDQLVANNAGQRGGQSGGGGGDYYGPGPHQQHQHQGYQQQQQQQQQQQKQQQQGMSQQAPRQQGPYGGHNNEWQQQGRNEASSYNQQHQQQHYQQQQYRQQGQQRNVPFNQQQQQHQQHEGRRPQGSYDRRQQQRQTALSPLAKEFVPKQQCNDFLGYDPNWVLGSDAYGGPRLEEMMNQLNIPDSTDFDANADRVLTTITDTINQLAMNPADFHRAARKCTGVLKKYLSDPDTLAVIVTLIFEQSVSNPNFCYSGARLCQEFHKNDIAVAVENTRVSFKNVLIERCQQEFTSCLETLNLDPDMQSRAPGLLMFLAELYLNFQLEISGKSTKNVLFGLAAMELMTALVSTKPVSTNMVKCVFRTLKLIGWELDHDPKAEVRRDMEKLMDKLSFLLLSPDTDEQSKKYVEMLFEMRKKDWNKTGGETSSSGSSAPPAFSSSPYYELPDNVEDEDYSLLIDDEPEEVRRAYEEFLKSAAGGK